MIKQLLIFLIAYFLVNRFIRKPTSSEQPRITSGWIVNGILPFFGAVVLSYFFNCGDLFVIISAIIIFSAQYLVNIILRPKLRETLYHYVFYQAIQLSIIYLVLLLFGRTSQPQWMLDQIYILLFSKSLHIEKGLIVPSILLILIFVSWTASDMITTLLFKYGNPAALSSNETAAGFESLSEDIKSKKQNELSC
jgi:hypothetical protein